MKLFVLAVGDRTRASSRLRVWDHVDWLTRQGHQVRACYVMPAGQHKITAAVAWLILRQWPMWVWNLFWADRIVVQESLLLAPVLWLTRLGRRRRFVFDFSDPVDTIGTGFRNKLQRLGFAWTTAAADHVIVENAAYVPELRRRGLAVSNCYGPVDVDRYQAAAVVATDHATDRRLRIGWTGSPGTLAFITPLFAALDAVGATRPIELMLIGVTSITHEFKNLPVILVPWTEAKEFELVPTFDLGLFALDGSVRSGRRGAGKLFVYMAAGVPFAATKFGIADDVMRESGVGYAVDSPEKWQQVLAQAVADEAGRQRMRASGADHATRQFSYASYRQTLSRVLA